MKGWWDGVGDGLFFGCLAEYTRHVLGLGLVCVGCFLK